MEKERKIKIKYERELINTPTTRGEKQKNSNDIFLWYLVVVVLITLAVLKSD